MKRIAVIGSGISGLAATHLLQRDSDVTLFEANPSLGGHARTRTMKTPTGDVAVDTGFIVYNEVNYPLLTRLFAHLDIPTQPTNMTFGVRYGAGELEFCASSLQGLFAQKKNLLSPRYYGMLADILRFFREAKSVLASKENPTLGELLDRMQLGPWVRERFIIPMGAAIWSTPPSGMLDFPAKSLIRFFDNHNLLSVANHHPWRTVLGGSRVYVDKIAATFKNTPRLATPIASVRQQGSAFEVTSSTGTPDTFDEVVFACHADTTLKLLLDPTPEEHALLSAFQFRDNLAILHSDPRLMPTAKAAWASWVYAAAGPDQNNRVSVTYWMNRLQNLDCQPVFVTLNPDRDIAPDAIHDQHTFRHPMFSQAAVDAQENLMNIQGKRGLWFAGAWQRNGFHEDGLWSAVRVAEAKGVALPW